MRRRRAERGGIARGMEGAGGLGVGGGGGGVDLEDGSLRITHRALDELQLR